MDERYEGQNLVHVFGTDRLGRDLLVRTFEGGRVSLMIAFAAVAVTVYICIWVLALCVWIVAAALGGVGVVELLLAVSGVTIGHFPYALASAGVGLGLVGVALFVGAGAWAASKQIARLSAFWARKAASPFWKGKGEKGGAAAHLAA